MISVITFGDESGKSKIAATEDDNNIFSINVEVFAEDWQPNWFIGVADLSDKLFRLNMDEREISIKRKHAKSLIKKLKLEIKESLNYYKWFLPEHLVINKITDIIIDGILIGTKSSDNTYPVIDVIKLLSIWDENWKLSSKIGMTNEKFSISKKSFPRFSTEIDKDTASMLLKNAIVIFDKKERHKKMAAESTQDVIIDNVKIGTKNPDDIYAILDINKIKSVWNENWTLSTESIVSDDVQLTKLKDFFVSKMGDPLNLTINRQQANLLINALDLECTESISVKGKLIWKTRAKEKFSLVIYRMWEDDGKFRDCITIPLDKEYETHKEAWNSVIKTKELKNNLIERYRDKIMEKLLDNDTYYDDREYYDESVVEFLEFTSFGFDASILLPEPEPDEKPHAVSVALRFEIAKTF